MIAPAESRESVLRARGLVKRYTMGELEVLALRGVDVDLRAGELLVMLGASGSGKSTLLNILGGLDVPSEGELFHLGENLALADEARLTQYRRAHVGFVFQFYNLVPSLTAKENVELVTDIAEFPLSAEAALGLVGLEDRLHHFPAQLSGGEQQRVAIARAVAKQPELLLCDEPTGALDCKTGRVVLEVLRRVNEELGTTTAVITHNAAIAEMGDRVLTLSDGLVRDLVENRTKRPPSELSW